MEFAWKAVGALGTLTTVVLALVGAAYWLFRTFSERWLQSKFDGRLEALRHTQNTEIEGLRFKINAMMDRASRMHGHEYRALPEIWEALINARGHVGNYVSPFQTFPDLTNLTAEQLEEALSDTPLSKTQKDHVKNAPDRMKAYREAIYYHRKSGVHAAARSFSKVVSTHAIFIPPELITPLRRLEELLWDALQEHEDNQELGGLPRQRTAFEALRSEGQDLVKKIERMFHERMVASPALFT